ncbi:MAG: choice-of-anchor D domain-containing protein [Candidatus Latescibacteria bacterium]|nr:choice-of-anchor D domain-containing protein [Candidatus Latescibacterota bacterium]
MRGGGTAGGNAFKTTNGGTAWALANSGLLGSVTALVIDPVNSQTLYAAVGGTSSNVYKTTNGGTSWTAAATGLKSNITAFALTVDPKTPQTLYAGVRGNGVYKTTDGGTSWTAVNSGIPDGTTTYGIAVDPSNPQTVYAGTAVGMFKTTSGGTSWTAVNTGLTNTGILSVAIAPSSPPTLYAGTDEGGVFRSTDGAATWAAFNAGLPDQTTGNAFAVDPSNSQTVYAGTGTGVYKSTYVAPAAPAISLSATALKFDSTKVAATSQKTLTIKNTGSGSLSVTGFRVTGMDSSQFTASPATATVAAGDSAKVTVTFTPSSAGIKSASLSVAHNATGSPASVSLSGVGVAATTPPVSTVPDPAKQDSTKLGVWLDLNTSAGNQMVAAASTGPGVEVTIQVFGRNLTSATSFGFTLAYDPAVLTFVTDPTRSKAGDYLGSSGIALSPLVSTTGGATVVTFGVALLGGSPVSGNGFLGTAVFKVSDKFTDGYTEVKVSELKLGGRAQTIQTSNAILKALKNAPPVVKFTIKPDAIKAGDAKGLVTLDASGSSDPDKDPITLKWSVPGGTFKKATSDTNRVAQVQFSGGATSNVEITLAVTDKNGAKSTLTQTLKVIAPPSATASVAVDLDAAADNQNVGLVYNVKPGDPITLQVFVKDVSGVTGYTVKVNYDSARIGTPAYANGSLVAPTTATFIPLTQAAGGAITGGGSTLPATGSSGSGLLATFTFKASANFEGSATLSVTSVTLRMGATIKELVTGSLDAQVTGDNVGKAGPVSDFGGDGVVDFEDFFSFASQFGLQKGDKGFNALFDLNNNGEVDFEDFFAFAGEFGAKE